MDPELESTDDFEAAFSEASGETPAPDAPAAADPAASAAPDAAAPDADVPAAPAAEAPTAPVAAPAPAVAAPAAEAPAAPAPADAGPESTPNIDPQHLARALAEEQQRLAQAQQQPAAPAATKEYTQDDFLDDAAKASLAKFKTEWPDEYPAIERMVDARARALVTNEMNTLVADLNKVLAPITQSLGKSEVNAHMAAIRSAHPDFDAVVAPLKEWVAGQPALFRAPLEQVLTKGTAQEVIQLVGMYKEAKVPVGAAPATPASSAPQEQPAVPAPKAPVSPAALAATAAVPATNRTQQQGGTDPNDFEGAFAEAAAALPS